MVICLSLVSQVLAAHPDRVINEMWVKLDALPQKDSVYIELLLEMTFEYQRISLDSTLYFAEEAKNLSLETGYIPGHIKGLYYMGRVFSDQANYSQALACFNEALNLSELTDNDKLKSNALNGMGSVYRHLNDYPTAIDCYLQCLKIREEIEDLVGIGVVSGNLGFAYQKFDDMELAEKYLIKSLEIDKVLKDTFHYVTSAINLGLLYENTDKLEKATEIYSDGIKLAQIIKDDFGLAICLGNLGVVFSKKGDLETAVDMLNQSLILKEKINLGITSKAYVYYHFQTTYFRAEDYHKSIKNGLKVLSLLESRKTNELVRNAYEYLEKAHLKKGDFSKAYGYREARDVLQDSVFNAEKSLQVKRLQTLYETDKKDLMLDAQNKEIAFLAATNSYQTRLTWAVGVTLLFIFISAYLYRSKTFTARAKKLQERFSQQLLGYQEEERQRISRDLHDSIGQSLVLIKNKVQLENNDTSEMIGQTLEEVRNISKQLHPVLLEKLGLTLSIKKLIEDLDNNTDIFIESELANIDNIFSKEAELHIYRILQEAIGNMVKHAQTTSAAVNVEASGLTIKCSVIDHGKGFDLTQDPGKLQSLGMLTLKERTKILNGKLLIDSTKGKGTSIVLMINKPNDESAK